jgi:hypothetical protein
LLIILLSLLIRTFFLLLLLISNLRELKVDLLLIMLVLGGLVWLLVRNLLIRIQILVI